MIPALGQLSPRKIALQALTLTVGYFSSGAIVQIPNDPRLIYFFFFVKLFH